MPLTSTLGSHSQRSAAGTLSRTEEMWLPHPHQEVLSRRRVLVCVFWVVRGVLLTACSAGGLLAHCDGWITESWVDVSDCRLKMQSQALYIPRWSWSYQVPA